MPWDISNYNINPALNTTINGIDIAELCSAAGYNNALRQIMADLAAWNITYGIPKPVSVANGGTGATTGAGAIANLGALALAYRDLPFLTKAAAFTIDGNDRGGGYLYIGAAAAVTINPDATTPMATGAVFPIRNRGSGVITITRGAGVALYANGSSVSANSVMAVGGQATLVRWTTDDWTINGSGLS